MIFGLPPKFSVWREGQQEECIHIIGPGPRFRLLAAPTGFGKSVVYVAAAALSGRTAILTSTKGLQSQLKRDFGGVDIRGRNNYPCRLNTHLTCDQGLCLFGVRCPMREEGGCLYLDQLKRARHSKLVITNYSYWLAQHEYSEGLGDFDFLVLDEAHEIPKHILDHMAVTIKPPRKPPQTLVGWREWAEGEKFVVEQRIKKAKEARKEKTFAILRARLTKISRLAEMSEDWKWEESPEKIIFSPVWPAPYADRLFLNVPKVLLTSATLVPKTADLLGIQDYVYRTVQSSFPVANRRFIHLPTVRINFRSTEAEEHVWIRKVDQIINKRKGKGIIHTVSYARRDLLLKFSKHKKLMLTHNSKNTEEVVQKFKKAKKGILISPSMATGWDFPGDQCRWQIIVKLPYPDMRGVIAQTRNKQDPRFASYLTAQQLVQTVGRGTRSKDDWCETFILDNNIVWFMNRNRDLVPEWFLESYSIKNLIPKEKTT